MEAQAFLVKKAGEDAFTPHCMACLRPVTPLPLIEAVDDSFCEVCYNKQFCLFTMTFLDHHWHPDGPELEKDGLEVTSQIREERESLNVQSDSDSDSISGAPLISADIADIRMEGGGQEPADDIAGIAVVNE